MAFIESLGSEISQVPVSISPIGAAAVKAVLKSIPTERTPVALIEYISNESKMLSAENYDANGYLMTDREKVLPRYTNLEFQFGVALAYKFFRQRAEGELPRLSSEFIEYYDAKRQEKMDMVYGTDPDDRIFGSIEEERIRRGLFVMLERDAYKVLRATGFCRNCCFIFSF